ncbi:imidazolonepropionase-like amidohydrolase [Chitinophaga skermanii]|uniref:Imidazolonepropionase-like amidohydrolase n=1 Tax=Chitinophaga skermanii TaxID=331697 RepID=A0A327R2F2_9BACT|nr:amidohydrolase family protein [Chitinophaga skermanii]RAJ10996.1 imidazolonepropionase-like amidohydrolase [Chitinophaga skermanii]
MKKIVSVMMGCYLATTLHAQENVYPAPQQSQTIAIVNATVHTGTGQVLPNSSIIIEKGKIVAIGGNAAAGAKVIDAKGKHVYPGIIAPDTELGLTEFESVRATNDFAEVGDINPSIRSIVSYNADSKVIGTLRSNGILLAGITPRGGLLSGSSSVVQLDAWNWEDAAYKSDNGIHFNMPRLMARSNPFGASASGPSNDAVKAAMTRIESVREFFREAKTYLETPQHSETNLKYEAVKGLFNKSQKLFIHCDLVKEMLVAMDIAKEFNFDVVIVGGTDAYLIADLLAKSNIPVILNQPHSLPVNQDDAVDQPYATAAQLQKAGVLFCIANEGFWQQRNLMFNAGTAGAYGLSKEEALSAITLNAAKILGIAAQTGSLEVGKDANIVISTGDILDMKSSVITNAFIQGREVSLDNKQSQLAERYKHKYNLQ